MRALRILHISDLHERAPFAGMTAKRQATIAWDETERGLLLGPRFYQALGAVSKNGIDVVCFTGDIADWGLPVEYAEATARLDQMLRTVGVPRNRFFAVPGNHDVQRHVEEAAWKGIRHWLGEMHEGARVARWFLGVQGPPPGTEAAWRDQLLARTGAFWAWYDAFRGDPAGRRSAPFGYRETLAAGSISGIETDVHIVGLDSAWLCGGDEDQGAILVTEEQVGAHIRRGEHGLDGLRIGLVHHPLDHLADHQAVRRLLGDDGVDLLLHGHQHTPTALVVDEPGSRLRILAAGCLMEGELGKGWPNGFQVIEMDPHTRAGAVHFRKWSKNGHFWPAGSDIYREAPDGTLQWAEAPLERAFQPREHADSTSVSPSPAQKSVTPEAVVLRMESVRLVDTTRIKEAIEQHGRRWPAVTIEWPPSLSELIRGLKAGLQGAMTMPGADHFAAGVPDSLERAASGRAQLSRKIPALVDRCRALSDEQLEITLRSLLLYANYRCHTDVAHHSSWEGLRPWQAPGEWVPLQHDPGQRVLGGILGAVVGAEGLSSGRVRMAEGVSIYTTGDSPGLYVNAPTAVLRFPSKEDLCTWFIPQLEFAAPSCNLPELYHLSDWSVDKIVDGSGREISV